MSNNNIYITPLFAASNQVNEKYPPLYYPSLGSTFVANYAMSTSADCTNPTESKFGANSLFDNNANSGSNTQTFKAGQIAGRYYTV